MHHHHGTAEEIIGRIATRQHGVVTRRLIDAGITLDELRHRLGVRALLRIHRGVYRVGHRAPSPEATYTAAVLACGDGALLGGLAAAWLWRLVKGMPPRPEVVARTARRIPGVTVRRGRAPAVSDVARCRGIPVTTVARTLVDIAAAVDDDTLMRGSMRRMSSTERRRFTWRPSWRCGPAWAARPAAEHRRRRRQRQLGKLERRFVQLMRENGLPVPRTNIVASGRRVDAVGPAIA